MLHLSYKDNSFDYILANGVMHNVSSKDEFNNVVREAKRVLKLNGKLCLNMFTSRTIDKQLKRPIDKKYMSLGRD